MTGGYIQANVLGRTRGLKFGSLAAENIMTELVALGVAAGGSYSSAMLSVIIYWGLYNNSYVKREILDVTFEEVNDWVDDNQADPDAAKAITDIARTYEESRASKTVLETLEKITEEIKKKMTPIATSISTAEPAGNASADLP